MMSACLLMVSAMGACGAEEVDTSPVADDITATEAAETEAETENAYAEAEAGEAAATEAEDEVDADTEAVTEAASGTETAEDTIPVTEVETITPSGNDWLLGAWVCEDAYSPLLMLFMEDGKVERLFRVEEEKIEKALVIENGELLYAGELALVTDITEAGDTADFRIYYITENYEPPSDEAYYYVLDKNDLLYNLEIGVDDFHYTLAEDSIAVAEESWDDDETEYYSFERAGSDSFTMTELFDDGNTFHLYRAVHLDALVDYLN